MDEIKLQINKKPQIFGEKTPEYIYNKKALKNT